MNLPPPRPGGNRSAETKTIAGLVCSIWRPPAGQRGPAPLVIFSHGFHGVSTQSTFLTEALARRGYVVVAPNHRDAIRLRSGMTPSWKPEELFEHPAMWTDATYRDRGHDITTLLQALRSDPAWADHIDGSRIVLAGHSLGGYTALGLAGAWPSWRLPDIKAVLALSPYCTPFVSHHTLAGLRGVPVMYQGGTWDSGITPFVEAPGGAYDQTPSPAYFVEFSRAGHFAWTDLRQDLQDSILYYSAAFLDRHVKSDHTADLGKRLATVADLRWK